MMRLKEEASSRSIWKATRERCWLRWRARRIFASRPPQSLVGKKERRVGSIRPGQFKTACWMRSVGRDPNRLASAEIYALTQGTRYHALAECNAGSTTSSSSSFCSFPTLIGVLPRSRPPSGTSESVYVGLRSTATCDELTPRLGLGRVSPPVRLMFRGEDRKFDTA
ncbi:hypothetical protein HPB50_015723 [Hyalomma asiaticum]|uniref:Uncharacterized protein n=1 Tax=Hyalomma asiaticum TaxID=266040 RepID=A0ACB7SYW5_HYAAI|nr:hypothetical protein HPB50_015723 [Hyalomma asiaticum]